MIGIGIIRKIRAHLLRKKKIVYPTAQPSYNDYSEAEKILGACVNAYDDKAALREIVAYLIKYKSIEGSCENDWSRTFATAPWMANKNNDYYVEPIRVLIKNQILEEHNGTLFLKNCRQNYKQLEFTAVANKTSFQEVCKRIRAAKGEKDYMTLKIATFHARTFMDMTKDNNLIHLMREYPNLDIQILCVGKHSGKVAKENADGYHLKQAIEPGLLKLYSLAFWRRNQFKIRIIRDNMLDASLRCTILMKENRIDFCEFTVMRTGYERGDQGKTFRTDEKSSLALQMNCLFDQIFNRAIPARRNLEWVIYWMKRVGGFLGIVVAVAGLSYFQTRIVKGINMGTSILLSSFFAVSIDKIIGVIKRRILE